MIRRIGVTLLLLGSVAGVAFAANRPAPQDAFNHREHAKLFVSCATCHAGVEQPAEAFFPTAVQCATCHDGTTERKVTWQPRVGPRATNLAFDHQQHSVARKGRRGTGNNTCADCHTPARGAWMTVRGPEAGQCLTCHKQEPAKHVSLPDTACATCHVPLSKATGFTSERIALFPQPASHAAPDFQAQAGHGVQAKGPGGPNVVATSCATCHVQTYCAACHVNAPEVKEIQALGNYAAATAVPHPAKAPASHAAADFEEKHGALAGDGAKACQTCHTQESCAACHNAVLPAAARRLAHAGPGRAVGAVTLAKLPSSHSPTWKEQHGPAAAASMQSCTSCHVRESCLACHVPTAGKQTDYHPASYLTRHPADAYTRANSCAECHNQGQFCQSCHQQAGVVAQRTLLGAGGYHDGNRQFFVGHGQAARQSLESCASCHVERDCLTCHSAQKGRGFSPHGPGFDAERLLRKNPQLCIACHGTAIPRR